jgi:hypothetical protein
MDAVREFFRRPGGGITTAVLLVLTVVFLAVFFGTGQVLIQFIPMYIVVLATIAAGLVAIATSLPAMKFDKELGTEAQNLIIVLLLSSAVILTLSAILCWTCQTPRPRERFENPTAGESAVVARLRSGIAEAEEAVCKYITRADQFIKSDVGPAGQKDPSLVSAAEQKAREGVNMVLCSDGMAVASVDASGSDEMVDLENRITRLESTLSGFTGVVFKHSYEETVPCKEGFVDVTEPPTPAQLEQRLAAIRTTIDDQQTKYLGPIDQKTQDLQSGKASDCDKRRGAKLAASGGSKANSGGS